MKKICLKYRKIIITLLLLFTMIYIGVYYFNQRPKTLNSEIETALKANNLKNSSQIINHTGKDRSLVVDQYFNNEQQQYLLIKFDYKNCSQKEDVVLFLRDLRSIDYQNNLVELVSYSSYNVLANTSTKISDEVKTQLDYDGLAMVIKQKKISEQTAYHFQGYYLIKLENTKQIKNIGLRILNNYHFTSIYPEENNIQDLGDLTNLQHFTKISSVFAFINNIINVVLLFGFGLVYWRLKEWNVENNLADKVKLIKLIIKITAILYLIYFIVSLIIGSYLLIQINHLISLKSFFTFNIISLVLTSLIYQGFLIFLYYQIYYNIICLCNNLIKDQIFDDGNVKCLNLISRNMIFIIIFKTIYPLGIANYINYIGLNFPLKFNNSSSLLNILTTIIIIMIIMIVKDILQRAIIIKRENDLTI